MPAGGPRQAALLALLLVNTNRAVSADRLLDALWGEQAGASAVKRLQVAVTRLRRTLADAGLAPALRTVAGGYLLAVGERESDAGVFAGLLDRGRGALESGDAAHAAAVLRAALALWRGPALADVAYEDWALPEIRRLEELRLTALETRFEAELQLGAHAEIAGELQGLVASNPTRERLTGQLMTALYRCGRQAEALDAFGRTRAHLAAELGLEPGPALRTLQAQILEQSTALELPSAAAAAVGVAPQTSTVTRDIHGRQLEPATAAEPRPAARRFVAVLALRADVDDPEALHAIFERCAPIVEHHGGLAERGFGDAVVGFFGLTEAHGDDTLRAARAAVELRDQTAQLRLGLEAGEVFVDTDRARPGAVATGATIRVAGRLAEQAAPGEILLGDDIRRALAADARVDAASGRLLELRVDEPALMRMPQTVFIGRAGELGVLRAALDAAVAGPGCRLVTVVGQPGVGKSRLVGEFVAALEPAATVLAGRCLAYGEGTTYRAIGDIVRGLGGDPRQRLVELLGRDEQAIRGILGAVGFSDEPAQAEETAWSLRRLLERLARDRPVVVAVEDIHWAEPPLLDVLDHVVTLSTRLPMLIVCLARPELLETRPAWAAPQPNRSLLVLDALGGDDAERLAERLGAGARAAQIARRADGNPLFVEQLVAVQHGEATSELPTSIHAVLAARIDRLDDGERTLLRHAAVEGRTFHVGAVAELLPEHERARLGARLVALARRGLIGADQPEFADEEAFRFTHALIREAAYAGIPKQLRAQLHASLAVWLEQRPTADEIVAHHLEQACLLATELGRAGELEVALADRAATRLERAARAARGRGDPASASALLERAVALLRADERSASLLPALGAALFEAGRLTDAAHVLDEAIERAHAPLLRARALVEREFVRLETETSAGVDRSLAVADAAQPVLEAARDDHGLARVWGLRAQIAWAAGRVRDADEAWCHATEHAERAGDERELFAIIGWRATAAVLGPAPVQEAIHRCDGFREIVAASPVAVAWIVNPLASLHAMKGDFELADELLREADETLRELGGLGSSAPHHEALVNLLADRPQLAEARLRDSLEMLSSMRSGGLLATTVAMLAQAVYAQGRLDEADVLCGETAAAAAAGDIVTQVIWRGVRAKTRALRARCEEAEPLAREAVTLIETTDLLSHRADALADLAAVLAACERPDDADAALRAALALYDSKGNAAAAARARSLLTTHAREGM